MALHALLERETSHRVQLIDIAPAIAGRLGGFSDAARINAVTVALDEIHDAIERDPDAARVSALRLVGLLERRAAEPPANRGGLAPWQALRINRYIRQHLEDRIRVDDLARQARLSVSHFCRAFRQSFGMTPHAYVIRLRIEQAEHLMLTTQESLTQIALACGLVDQAHLSRLFRRLHAETPSSWRRRNMADAAFRS